jgi:hypothetical protein
VGWIPEKILMARFSPFAAEDNASALDRSGHARRLRGARQAERKLPPRVRRHDQSSLRKAGGM